MALYNTLPPHKLHSSEAVAPSEALALLSDYLERAATDASLHPNALLTESGPTSASQGANTGLILHNLKRVEAGLRGEHLGADLSFEEYGGEGLLGLQVNGGDKGDGPKNNQMDPTRNVAVAEAGSDDWQDKAEFEVQQGLEGIEDLTEQPAVVKQSREDGRIARVQAAITPGDKELRKKKKEKRKQERSEKGLMERKKAAGKG